MIRAIASARVADLNGSSVRRVLPDPRLGMVGPFIFLDHFGPTQIAPGIPRDADIRPHPHIGIATLTYLFEGAITHRDSLGSEAEIRQGEVNWMICGRGITHSERFEAMREAGGTLHGLQAWVALPDHLEDCEPAFSHHGPEDLPTYRSADGLWARLLAGKGFHAEARVPTHSPLMLVHWKLAAGAKAQMGPDHPERAAYVVEGAADIAGVTLREGQMAMFEPGEPVLFTALEDSQIILLGGEPVGRRYLDWNFVSSRPERIEQARRDWLAGRFVLPPNDPEGSTAP